MIAIIHIVGNKFLPVPLIGSVVNTWDTVTSSLLAMSTENKNKLINIQSLPNTLCYVEKFYLIRAIDIKS